MSKQTGNMFYHEKLGGKIVHGVYQDPLGNFWVGTHKGLYFGASIKSLVPHLPDKIDTPILTFYQTEQGHLWAGGGSTIYELDPAGEVIRRFGPEEGLQAKDVRSIYEDMDGRIWIGTYQGGLYCFYDNKLVSLKDYPNYMLGNDIFTLTKDKFGFILISSNNGLLVLHEDALIAFLDNKNDYLVPYYIGVESGVYNTEFNGGFFNNHINLNGSIIYFPTAQGILVYLSNPIQAKKSKLILSKILADGEEIGQKNEISRQTKQVRFDFGVNFFSEFDNVYYQYKLEQAGKSVEWSRPSRSTFVEFDYLPPGEYDFKVRSINGSNDPYPETIAYTFKVLPYFYEHISFQTSIFILILLSIFILNYRRNKQKQDQIRHELEISNTITELELNAMHALMNPHLIFNSLSTLIYLIRSKSFEKAENFTIEFAQMLRNILEKSGDHFTQIGQEIQVLKNYLEVQKIRYHDSITYNIECDEGLFSVIIPAMLVQPLVENAIVHGLSHASAGGNLCISFKELPEGIEVMVEDDGIGLSQSEKIQSGKKRKSMGLYMLHKKMDLMKTKYGISINFTLQDIGEGNVTGTRAILLIGTKPL